MNKRDIIKMCLTRMIANENAGKELHNETVRAYNECKKEAEKAGYTGACFRTLWTEATIRHARKLNVKEDNKNV